MKTCMYINTCVCQFILGQISHSPMGCILSSSDRPILWSLYGHNSLGSLAPTFETRATAIGGLLQCLNLFRWLYFYMPHYWCTFKTLSVSLNHNIYQGLILCFAHFCKSQKLKAVQRQAIIQRSKAMWSSWALSSSTQHVQRSV